MKKVTLVLIIFSFQVCFSQSHDEIIPKSPEASSFIKYGDIDSNLFTGAPNISVPIHTIKGKQISHPIYLSYDAYKDDLNNHSEESKRFKDLYKYKTNLTFNSPLYEQSIIENDSILGKKRIAWHKNLSKDAYFEEGLNVLGDLKLKKQTLQLVKN